MLEWSVPFYTLLATLAGAAFVALMSTIHRHSIYLYGHRIQRSDHKTAFRLAIQNAENASLDGRMRIELACGPGAIFSKEPQVFAGPRGMLGSLAPDKRRYFLEFDCLPAYDTWLFQCDVASEAPAGRDGSDHVDAVRDVHGITLRLAELDEDGKLWSRKLKRMSASVLTLSASESFKVVGRARKPLLRLGLLTAMLSGLFYVLTAAFWLWLADAPAFRLVWQDIPALALIAALTWAFIRYAAPPAARAVQGYLDPTEVAQLVPK